MDIASFFYNNAIPFNAVKSEEFVKIVLLLPDMVWDLSYHHTMR
jgi:hypothetical protein